LVRITFTYQNLHFFPCFVRVWKQQKCKFDEYITSGIQIIPYSESKWNMAASKEQINCTQHFWHHSDVSEELKPSS
jgi:hypothetical protein